MSDLRCGQCGVKLDGLYKGHWCSGMTGAAVYPVWDNNRTAPAPRAATPEDDLLRDIAALIDAAKNGVPQNRHAVCDVLERCRDRIRAAPPEDDKMNDEMLKAAVDRFLAWRLPATFRPDCGISFDGRGKDARGFDKQWPIGTNLFTADEARAMFEHCLAGLEASHAPVPDSGSTHWDIAEVGAVCHDECAVAQLRAKTVPREPDGYAYRYRTYFGDVIRFGSGGEYNLSPPIAVIPYYFGPEQPRPEQPYNDAAGTTPEAVKP